MADSTFYLTEFRSQEVAPLRTQSLKKTLPKTFQEWPKVVKSITQYLLPEQYYSDKSFKPGIDVYKALLNSQGPSMKQYNFNMPLTLVGESYTYDIIHNHYGTIQKKMQVNQQEIQTIIDIKANTSSQPLTENKAENAYEEFIQKFQSPLFVCRVSNGGIGCKSSIITLGEYIHKIKTLPKVQEEVYQKFIVPYQFKANIIRLHLYTRRSKRQTLTNAIKILNKLPLFNSADKTIHSHLFCINFDKENSFDTVQLKGKPLKSFIQMTQSLVNYLEDFMGICITEVVTDYVMDYHKIPWFLSLKSVKYTMKLTKDVKLTSQELEQLSLSTVCKLCGLYLAKQQVTKMVTYKLIYGFLNHIKLRGVNPELIVPKSNPNLQCKICQMCYKMIIKQIQLYKLSTQLARLQHTIQNVDDITDVNLTLGDKKIKTSGYRWRLMVYFNSIKESEELKQYSEDNLELQFKLFGTKVRFPLKERDQQKHSKAVSSNRCSMSLRNSISQSKFCSKSIGKQSTAIDFGSQYLKQECFAQSWIRHLKTLYFFSKTNDIADLLKEQQIKFRITRGKDWSKWVCEGESRGLGYLTNHKEEGQICGSEIYMFFQNMRYLKLGVSLGLICDGMQEMPRVQRSVYKQIEVVKGDYYICQPLPINWIQLFSDQ